MDGIFRLPSAVPRDPDIDIWFADQVPERAALVRPWFEKMRRLGDDVRETMHDHAPTACVGDAAFAYVNVFKTHAAVGFFHGADLKDPAGLLEGSGKRMRHVKLRPGRAVDAAALAALIAAAYQDIRRRTER